MKTQFTLKPKKTLNKITYATIFMIAVLAFNPVYGQSERTSSTETAQDERTVSGVISDEFGPLEGANIILKGTAVGIASNSKGEYTFPRKLKTGDVLVISYLGYETTQITIKPDTSFIRLILSQDLLEFVGSLNSDKPYKSKRTKQ
jgi:hypothetical protein